MTLHLHTYVHVQDIWKDPLFASLKEREALFVVPSGTERPYLKEQLRGEGLFHNPPSVLTWSGLVRFLAEHLEEGGLSVSLRRQIDPPDHWIILRHLWKQFREKAGEETLPRGMCHPGFIRQAGAVLREMLREDVTFEHLKALWGCSCSPGEPCSRGEPSGALCWLLGAYEAYLKDRGLVDSAQVPSQGAGLCELPGGRDILKPFFTERPLVFVGFLSFATGQLRLVEQLLALGGEAYFWVPSPGLPEWDPKRRRGHYSVVEQLNCGMEMVRAAPSPRRLVRLGGGDTPMTARVLARELALWSLGKGHFAKEPFPSWEKIALVAPGEEMAPLEEALRHYHLPFSLKSPLPLGETPLWGLFRRMVSLGMDHWPGEDTAYLLGHPFFLGDAFPLEEALQALPRGEEGWEAFLAARGGGKSGEMVTLWKGLGAFRRLLSAGGTPRELLEGVLRLFEKTLKATDRARELGGEELALDDLVRGAQEVLLELKRKLLFYEEMVPDVGEAAQERLRGREAQAFLELWARETALRPAPPLRCAMSLFRDAPPILFQSEVLCFTGVVPSRWPGASGEAAFLSDQERSSLQQLEMPELSRAHLPLAGERRMARQALFRRILAAAEQLTICATPLQDFQGRPLGEAPFLLAALEGEKPWSREVLSPLERSLGQILPSSKEFYFEEAEVPGDLPGRERHLPEQRFCTPPEPRGRISQLDRFEACPFRFYGENLLEAPPGVFEYDPRKAGTLLHELWEALFKAEHPLDTSLETLWQELVKAHYPELFSSLRRKERELRYQAFQGAAFLLEMELRLRGQVAERRLEEDVAYREPKKEVLFRGRVDRMDLFGNGTAVLLDYKLGKGGNYSQSLQLPAYALALDARGETVPGWAYFGLKDRKMVFRGDQELRGLYTGSKRKGSKEKSPEELLSRASEVLEECAEALSSGVYAPHYENNDVCTSCPYKSLCRREEIYWKKSEEEEVHE